MKENTKIGLQMLGWAIFFLLFVPIGAILGSNVYEGFYILCCIPGIALIIVLLLAFGGSD